MSKKRIVSLRFKISLALLVSVGVSLVTYALYSIRRVQGDKRNSLYYSALIESSALGDYLSRELLRARGTLSNCTANASFPSGWNYSATAVDKLGGDPALVDLLRQESPAQVGKGWKILSGNDQGLLVAMRENSTAVPCVFAVSSDFLRGELVSKTLSNFYLYDGSNKKIFQIFRGSALPSVSIATERHPMVAIAGDLPLSQGSGDFDSADGRTFVGSYYRVKESPFLFISETPREDFGDQLRGLAWELLLFALAVGSLAMIGGFYFSSKITAPLETLMRQTDELAAGRFDTARALQSNDEIGELSQHFVRLSQKLSERESQLEKASELASRDGLTGLHNYRFFRAKLDELIKSTARSERPFGLLIMDIDHFKSVNDTYGHPQGDRVLKEFVQVLRENTRATDIVCRYGGEEFVVVAPDSDAKSLRALAERIREAFAGHRIEVPEKGIYLEKTVSIGIAPFSSGLSSDQLIKLADGQLYAAKTGGRNRVAAL